MSKRFSLILIAAVLAHCVSSFAADSDVIALVKALASEKEDDRSVAIVALKKLGADAEGPLARIESEEKLTAQQLILVQKILGDRLIETTTLKPMDLSKLTPFGEDKAKGIAGNPDLLVNRDSKTIVLNGEFVLAQGPLEYIVVVKHPNAKTHETIAGVYASPRDICYALLACEYTYAGEMDDEGKINLPREAGILISVEYEWEPVNAKMGNPATGAEAEKNPAKKWIRVPVEFFAWNSQTEKPMRRSPFAFTGSKFERGENGKMDFMADIEKSVVALKYDPYAIMNTLLDTKNIDPQHAAGYSINRHAIPQKGTKCRVVFEPWAGGELTKVELKDTVEGKGETPAPPPQKQ